MKRAIGAVLAAVILMVSCLSGCGGDGGGKDTFPDNSSLKLSASKYEIIQAQNLELLSSNDGRAVYVTKKDQSGNSQYTQIAGIDFFPTYDFGTDARFSYVGYSSINTISDNENISEDELRKMLETVKNHFDSVYGEGEPLSDASDYTERYGYVWKTTDDQGEAFEVCVSYLKKSEDSEPYISVLVARSDGESSSSADA